LLHVKQFGLHIPSRINNFICSS